jgi:uridine kinase
VPAPEDVDDLVAEVRRRPARAADCRIVAIDGPSGSGKTELAGRLAARLAAPVVHMDDLYPGWDGLADAVPALVGWLLAPLAAGRPAGYRRFDWVRGEYAEWREVPPASDLLVEGVGSGARACAPYVSLLVWVEAPREVRFARGIARDGEAYRPHWERWARQEEAMFAAEGTRARADVIIDGTDDPKT